MKKNIFKLFSLALFSLLTLVIFAGCTTDPVLPTSIDYDTTSVSLKVGETFKFEISDSVGYTSNDKEVISLDRASATITALSEGTAVITIYLLENTAVTLEVTVTVSSDNYTITYDLDGGTCTGLIESYKGGSDVTLPTPTKEGFEFAGWYEGETKVESITNGSKNYTLKAHWASAQYTISYDLDGGTCAGLVESYQEGGSVTLPTPTKAGFEFLGWYEGETKVESITNGAKNYTLVARWNQVVFAIEYNLDGGKATGLVTSFDKDQSVTLPTPTKDGFTFDGWYEGETKVETITNKDYNLTARWIENGSVAPTSIEIIPSTNDGIIYTDTELYLNWKVLPEGASQNVVWRALNRTKALIGEDGKVTVLRGDEASFQVYAEDDTSVSSTITLSVRGYINPYKFLDSIQVENPVATKIRAYTTDIGYETYLLGGVVNYLFEDISIIENWVPVGRENRPGTSCNGNPFSARYVTFHDVGFVGSASTTSNNCKNGTTSWHYSVGNDGLYQQLPLNEVGFHAGDGTADPLVFYDSGVKAPAGDDTPAKITINQVTGVFQVNGIDTTIVAPLNSETQSIVNNSQLPYTGINNYVDETTGNYMIGKTYWNTTYDILSNRGGNLNSIGIESCINTGSNIYYTWELSAKLISTIILPECNLLPRDVKQHNTFSGKNCPQTMRRASMWENFMALVEAEYIIHNQLFDYKFEFICDSEYMNANGMIKSLPTTATEISYSIRMTSTRENIDQTFTYKVTLPAASNITY